MNRMEGIFNFDKDHAIQSRGSGGILISGSSKPGKSAKTSRIWAKKQLISGYCF